MSSTYNGSRYSKKLLETQTERTWDPGDADELHTSKVFRGFEKVPIVLCERMDITPYLKRSRTFNIMNTTYLPKVIKIDPTTNKPKEVKYEKLLHKCSILLVRDDLDHLIKSIKNNAVGSTIKCKICDKVYPNTKKLQTHIDNKHIIYKSPNKTPKRVSFSDHVIIHEVKEYHSCRKCTKIFDEYSTLKLHMKQSHRKRKCYICMYCSKDFVDRTFFKVHIKLHCDACGLLLGNRKKYLEHRRHVCKIVKKYECKICHLVFFNFMDLKDHNYDHLGTFFICDICKDQFDTKCGVSHHIKFLHSKRPVSLYTKRTLGIEKVYVCNFCKESSVEETIMENHVSSLPDLQNRAMTGYKDYYFCDQCLKKFSTETDMLQHKWTHFLKNNENQMLKANSLKMKYTVGEELPQFLNPTVVVEKLILPETQSSQTSLESLLKTPSTVPMAPPTLLPISSPIALPTMSLTLEPTTLPKLMPIQAPQKQFINVSNLILNGELKKPIIDPNSKKTLLSKHQCSRCNKYLSSNYCLKRHMAVVHNEGCLANLQCPICEETFVWPSLLKSHKCIRTAIPEMPFDDARPEIHFDNLNEQTYDDLEVTENDDDYMNNVDFEIPAPIVELTEYENENIVVNSDNGQLNSINNEKTLVNNLGYKILMQEVPIEF